MPPAAPSPHPYAEFLHAVEKPARYTGGEIGSVRKDWATVEAKVCLAFPDIYDIGMSHLGFKILYSILNDEPRTLAERTYAPWPDMERELRARKLPLVSHETARPLRDFDVVGLSLQYELTYTNVLTILDLGGIPLRSCDRGEDDPLVLGGGPTATHPEPVANFFDAFVIGDGERACTEIALAWVRMKKEGTPREERLHQLSKMQGVYVPSMYGVAVADESGFEVVTSTKHLDVPKRVQRFLLDSISEFPFPKESPVGGPEAIFDRMSIEIARGCTEGCRFCQAGMIYRPVRERDPEEIVDTIVEAVKRSGYDAASLTSLSTADASCISPLIKKVADRLSKERVSLSVASLRAYGLSDDLLDELRRVRAAGLTFAPEAGTQRMRDVINKNVTEEQLLETADRVFRKGWDRMKLYFMIGLPTEEDVDVRGIVETGKRALDEGRKAIRESGRKAMKKASVTVSVSTHVPKPHTPFQWCAMDTLAEVRRKQTILSQAARAAKVDLKMHDSSESVLEGIFARGDRRLGDVIEEAWKNGARFDSWEEHVKLPVWEAALEKHAVVRERYLGTIPVTARLPWDHIDVGLEDGFLATEYRKALKSRLSPPCGKAVGMFIHHTNVEDATADARRLVCYDCGVACDMTQMREERIHFLEKMDAHKRLPILESAASPNTPEAPGIDEEEVEVPAAAKAPLVTYRYRLSYEKLGPVAFLGHLDLVRSLPRVFRRVEVPMAYSQGFHPKPDLVFGPALSLGVPSLAEYVDIKLLADVDAAWLHETLNRAAPEGLHFTGAAKLGPQDPGLNKMISKSVYALAFARSALPNGEEGLRARLDDVMAMPSLLVRREIERNVKMVDVRTYLTRAELGESRAKEAIARAGLIGDLVVVGIETHITGAGAVKASEVAEVLTSAETPFRAVRIALLAPNGETPLAVAGRGPLPKPQAELPPLELPVLAEA